MGGNLAVTGTSTLTGNVTHNGATNTFQSLGSGVGQTLNLSTTYFSGQNAATTLLLQGNVTAGNFAAYLNFGNNYTGNQSGAFIGFAAGQLAFETGGATPGTGTVALVLDASQNATFAGTISMPKTITAAGTTGAQTINKASGTVRFAAAAGSLVVTDSVVTANSIITGNLITNDTTAVLGAIVPASGSFTIYMKTNPTAETGVCFRVTN